MVQRRVYYLQCDTDDSILNVVSDSKLEENSVQFKILSHSFSDFGLYPSHSKLMTTFHPSPIVSLSSLSHSIPSHYIRLMSSMFGTHTFLSSSLTFSFSLLRGLTFSLPPHSFSLPPSRFNIFSSHPLRLLSGYFMSHVNEHFDKALSKKKNAHFIL